MAFQRWSRAGDINVFLLAGGGADTGSYPGTPGQVFLLAIDGLKEVQESVMRIEAGLSTYEKELAIMGEDYQEISAGLSRPVWITDTYQQQIAASRQTEEEKRAT